MSGARIILDPDSATFSTGAVVVIPIDGVVIGGGGGGGPGTLDHRDLTHRSDADQHPTAAITGLDAELAALTAADAAHAAIVDGSAHGITALIAAEAVARNAAITAAINALVNGAPGALDQLNELATAMGNDPNFATTITNALAGKQPLDATLTALAGLATLADRGVYFTGTDVAAVYTLTAFARSLLDDPDADTALTTLGATTVGKALVTAASQAAGRTALGLGTAATSAVGDFDAAGAAAAFVTLLSAHLADTTSAHVAVAVDITDAGNYYTGTTVEAALQEAGAALASVNAAALVNRLVAGWTIPPGALSRWVAGRGRLYTSLVSTMSPTDATATLNEAGIYGDDTTTRMPILIDQEWTFPSTGTGTTALSGIARGVYGTVAASHAIGAPVRTQRHRRIVAMGDSVSQGDYPLGTDAWLRRAVRALGPELGGVLGDGLWPMWRNTTITAEGGTQEWRVFGSTFLTNYSTSGLGPVGASQFSTLAYTASARASNVVTLTVASGHNVVAGMSILVLTGTFTGLVTVTSVTSTTIVYTLAGADNASGGSGTIAGGAVFTVPAGVDVTGFDIDWIDQGTTSAQWSYSLDGGATWVDNPVASTSPAAPERKRTRVTCDSTNPTTIQFRAATAAGVAHQFCLPWVGFTTYSTRIIDGYTEGVLFDNLGFNGSVSAQFTSANLRFLTDAVVTNGSAVVTSATAAFVANDVGSTIYLERVAYTILTVDSGTQVTLTSNYAGSSGTGKRLTVFAGTGKGDWLRAFAGDRASLYPHLVVLGPFTNDPGAGATPQHTGDVVHHMASRLKVFADVVIVNQYEQNAAVSPSTLATIRAELKGVAAALGVACFDMYDAFVAEGYTGFTATDTLNGTVASGSGFNYDTLHLTPRGNRFIGAEFARGLRIAS